MNAKRTIVCTLLLFLVSNVLSTLWYMAADEANYVPFRRDEVNYAGLMLNHLVFAGGFSYLFPHLIRDRNSKPSAFLFGAVLAMIMFVPTGLVVRSIWRVDFNAIFALNALVHMLIGGIMGLVASLVYNYKRK